VYDAYKNRFCSTCWKIIGFTHSSEVCHGCWSKCRSSSVSAAKMLTCWKAQLRIKDDRLLRDLQLANIPPTQNVVRIISILYVFCSTSVAHIAHVYNMYLRCSLHIDAFEQFLCISRNVDAPMNKEWLQVQCMQETNRSMQELWEMDTHEFENLTQWLPREMLGDTLELL